MKFKKPSTIALTDSASMIGGAIAGGMLSNGVMGLVSKPSASADPVVQKKERNMDMIKRIAFAVVTGYGAASIDGSDNAAKAAKGACMGAALVQVSEVIKSLAHNSSAIKTGQAAVTTTQKFVSNGLGLGCACNNEGLGKARRRNRGSLRMVAPQSETPVFNLNPDMGGNALDNAVNTGAMAM